MFRQELLTVDALKQFHNHVRCATYPDVEKFDAARTDIEEQWPAYANEYDLSRPPAYVWPQTDDQQDDHLLEAGCSRTPTTDIAMNVQNCIAAGKAWLEKHHARLQKTLSHMNHHVHPVMNSETGERRPLKSCQPKDRPKECKAGFPLQNEMTDDGLLVCPCIAQDRGLASTGPRSRVGSLLPRRNHAWLNAGPSGWVAFNADNGDVKLPFRVPIIPETHEASAGSAEACCKAKDELDLAYEVQMGQLLIAGYFGGYSAKMLEVGKRELAMMEEAMGRKMDESVKLPQSRQFADYSRRLLRGLEAKGVIRTSVETTNLMVNMSQSDLLSAECVSRLACRALMCPLCRSHAVQTLLQPL